MKRAYPTMAMGLVALSILLLHAAPCQAQWQLVGGVPASDLQCVNAYDAQHLQAGSNGSWLRSTDGGGTWTAINAIDQNTAPLLGCIFQDIRFTDANNGLATGAAYIANNNIVWRTTNGGANWTAVFNSQTGIVPRSLVAMDFGDAQRGVAVGLNGLIVGTVTGGSTWGPVSSGTTSAFRSVAYATPTIVVAVGDNVRARSINGGNSWTLQSSGGDYQDDVVFVDATTGFSAAGERLLKTIDAGETWQDVGMVIGDHDLGLKQLAFLSATEGYAVSPFAIMHTTDGGVHWEYFPTTQEMNDLLFQGTSGIAVGDIGTVYRTGGGGAYHPIAAFDASTSYACVGASIELTSNSAPGLTHQWFVDDAPISTTTDASFVINTPNTTVEVELVVSNGTWTDTLSRSITSQASLEIICTPALPNDSACYGQSLQVQVPNSQLGTSFQLRRGTTALGAAQYGGAGTLSFATGPITAWDDILNVLCTRTIGDCGTHTETIEVVVHLASPQNDRPVHAVQDTVCLDGSTTIEVGSTQTNVTYELRKGTTYVAGPFAGTGATLSFPTGALQQSTTFSVYARGPQNCNLSLLQTATVVVDDPAPFFALDNANPEAGTSVSVINTSEVVGGSYAWDFGTGATPPSSTSEDPPAIQYGNVANTAITLTTTGPSGCVQSFTRNVHVIPEFADTSCTYAQAYGAMGGYELLGLDYGPDGALYAWLHDGSYQRFTVFSNHGDTLTNEWPYDFNMDDSHHLVKFNAKGIPQWTTRWQYDDAFVHHGDVRCDSEGNIIVCMFANLTPADSIRFYSADGRYTAIVPPMGPNNHSSVITAKYGPNGMLQWTRTALEPYFVEHLTLDIDGDDNILLCGQARMVKYAADGTPLWTSPDFYEYSAAAFDADGGMWAIPRLDAGLLHYQPDGTQDGTWSLATSLGMPPSGNFPQIYSYQIHVDDEENVYIAGNYLGDWEIGPDTIRNNAEWSTNYDAFVMKVQPDGTPLWARQLQAGSVPLIEGMDIHDGRVVLLVRSSGADSIAVDGVPPIPVPYLICALWHLDTDGGTQRLDPLYNAPANTGTSLSGVIGNLRFSEQGELAAMIPFTSDFQWNAYDVQAVNSPSLDIAVLMGDLDCMIPSLPGPLDTPIAYFTYPSDICTQNAVQFADGSLNGAELWEWTFEGGNPATSSLAAPLVQFPVPGPHVVSLTVSNSNGSGTTYTQTVEIDICQGVSTPSLPSLMVYPSPAATSLNVHCAAPNGTPVVLYDGLGREVLRTTVINGRSTMGIMDLAHGQYIVQVPGHETVKVSVER